MDKPVLKQIHILVFPSYGSNFELRTKDGNIKFNQWLKQIELAGKRKDTAFIVVPDNMNSSSAYTRRINAALKKNLKDSYSVFSSNWLNNPKSSVEAARIISKFSKNFSLGKTVEVKHYGQFVPDAGVDAVGGTISSKVSDALKSKGSLAAEKSLSGMSVKFPDLYFANMARKRFGSNVDYNAEKEIRTAINSMRERRRIIPPVKLAHAIKRSTSMGQVAQNLNMLASKKRKLK